MSRVSLSLVLGVVSLEHTPDLLRPYRGPGIYEGAWRKGGAQNCVYTTYTQGSFQTRRNVVLGATPQTPSAVDCISPETLSPRKLSMTQGRPHIPNIELGEKRLKVLPAKQDSTDTSSNVTPVRLGLVCFLNRGLFVQFSKRYWCWRAATSAPWPGHPETNYSGIQRRQLASNTASLRLRAAALLLLQEMLASGELHLLLILLQEVCAGILPG